MSAACGAGCTGADCMGACGADGTAACGASPVCAKSALSSFLLVNAFAK